MNEASNKLLEHGIAGIFILCLIVAVIYLWARVNKLNDDFLKLSNEFLKQSVSHAETTAKREREISEERREDLEVTIKAVHSINETVKNNTDAVKELSHEVRKKT